MGKMLFSLFDRLIVYRGVIRRHLDNFNSILIISCSIVVPFNNLLMFLEKVEIQI